MRTMVNWDDVWKGERLFERVCFCKCLFKTIMWKSCEQVVQWWQLLISYIPPLTLCFFSVIQKHKDIWEVEKLIRNTELHDSKNFSLYKVFTCFWQMGRILSPKWLSGLYWCAGLRVFKNLESSQLFIQELLSVQIWKFFLFVINCRSQIGPPLY